MRDRLAAETPLERDPRLQQMKTYQHDLSLLCGVAQSSSNIELEYHSNFQKLCKNQTQDSHRT